VFARLHDQLARPGFLVLSDSHDPGWRARLDGEPVEILRANWAFRAVPVPAGRHVVELCYAPASFRRGVALAAAALVLGVVPALGRGRRRRGLAGGAAPPSPRGPSRSTPPG